MSAPGNDHSRLRATEHNQAAHSRRLEPNDSRTASPIAFRQGIHKAICVSQITHDTPGEIQLVFHDGTAYRSAQKNFDCRGYLLNADQTIEPEQAIFVIYMA